MRAITLALFAIFAIALADNWAVLISGSRGYGNYRHHADTCHAYQIMKKHGIPDDHIIVFLYDDVARDRSNPFPGKMYNKPGDDSEEVYETCLKDYTGAQTTPANLIAALTGEGSGKVLKSTSEDNVFIFYTDHGGVGLVAMPTGGYLYANDLHAALLKMHSKNMYKKLVFYMEACESGSMFEGILEDNLNIYATSASNSRESSWGCYCPPQDVVKGQHMYTCLGDLYSVNWMEDSDVADMKTETVGEQTEIVKKKTTKSHVCEWGQSSLRSDKIGEYQSRWTEAHRILRDEFGFKKPMRLMRKNQAMAHPIDSRDATFHALYYGYLANNNEANGEALKEYMAGRLRADAIFAKIGGKHFEGYNAPRNFDCHKEADATVEKYCGAYDDYSLKYHRVIVNMCENMPTAEVIAQIRSVC